MVLREHRGTGNPLRDTRMSQRSGNEQSATCPKLHTVTKAGCLTGWPRSD